MLVRERLAAALSTAIARARQDGALSGDDVPAIQMDVPPSPDLGDFSSDVARSLARSSRQTPSQVAETLATRLQVGASGADGDAAGWVERVEVSPSGVLNFHLRADWLQSALQAIRTEGSEFGRSSDLGNGQNVLLEYVSADPTGPLTLVHGRGAAVGDALANVLAWNGYQVTRESYINDAGSQMERFGRSLSARYLQELGRQETRVPVDGFPDEYVVELAKALRAEHGERYRDTPPGERLEAMKAWGRNAIVEQQRVTLTRFGVRFDDWSSERTVAESGLLGEVLNRLRDSGAAYEADGALWLASTRFGDTVDRALVRGNGRATYLANDLAYHLGKFQRGFHRVIDVWNAEHEDYIPRTRAGLRALGCEAEALEILIFAPISVKIDGVVVEGTQRGQGGFLGNVLDEVGHGVARFFYLLRPAASPLELDLDLARTDSSANPAWVVRQALERARREGLRAVVENETPTLTTPEALALARRLATFPDEVRAAARERDPYRVARYAQKVAGELDAYLDLSAEAESTTRPVLAEAAGIVLQNALTVLGAPLTEPAAG